jgi:hypothetical protein
MDGGAADRIMTLVLEGPARCVECLVGEIALPEERVRQAATDLVAAGVLIERPGHCVACQGETRFLQATGRT